MPVNQRDRCEMNRPSQRRPLFQQRVREAMQRQRMQAWIAGQHFPARAGCRVALDDAVDVFAQMTEHELDR